jgi:hypothetical protein
MTNVVPLRRRSPERRARILGCDFIPCEACLRTGPAKRLSPRSWCHACESEFPAVIRHAKEIVKWHAQRNSPNR